MAVRRSRIDALRAIVAGARSRSNFNSFDDVDQELQEIGHSVRITLERRRNLLQVFHGMRALDSALKEVLRSHGVVPKHSIGKLLHQMASLPANHPCHLDSANLGRFLNSTGKDRNRIMHEANAFPRTNREADQMMGELAACFALLVR